MLTLAKVILGSPVRGICGYAGFCLGAEARGHAYSVRRGRESAYDRKAPHGLPPPSLVPTNLLDEWFENE